MFNILQDLRVHVAQWFKSANLMIKKRLLPINICFLRFQVYARAYVRIWSLSSCPFMGIKDKVVCFTAI